MKLHSVTLHNIRNFFGTTAFNFENSKNVNTVSGINGSGKSTIFKSILLAQKAYFLYQLNASSAISSAIDHNEVYVTELAKFFNQTGSYIELCFNHSSNDTPLLSSFRLVCATHLVDKVGWRIDTNPLNKDRLDENWNINAPKNIVLYIDSNKAFQEENILHSNLSLYSQSDPNKLVIDAILNPDKLFSNIYETLIKDFLLQRIVPLYPNKRDLYFDIAKVLLKKLLPELELSNFSGQHFTNQFVLLGKANKGVTSTRNKIQLYDSRNLSSGEKVLFYTLLFISYIPKISLLVIDEPENHFHEDLLVKFIKMLYDISKSTSLAEYVDLIAEDPTDKAKERIEKFYSEYKLSQVFLLTHSKGLIYNNFSDGTNYYINNGLTSLNFDDFESVLRTIGLSSIYPKVLFVEGKKEKSILEVFFNRLNIKVQPLGGHPEVMQVYGKLLNIKPYLSNYHFCFVIDQDTRNTNKTQQLRSKDTSFFDKHFKVLDRHELENYLLEPKLFKDIIDKHSALTTSVSPLSEATIQADMLALALTDKERVFTKELMELNDLSISELNSVLVKKATTVTDLTAYTAEINTLLTTANTEETLRNKFIANFQQVTNKYTAANWQANWQSICDGKAVYNKILDKYAVYLGLTHKRLEEDIITQIQQNPAYEINTVINAIISMFN
jgi:hypothetical protein